MSRRRLLRLSLAAASALLASACGSTPPVLVAPTLVGAPTATPPPAPTPTPTGIAARPEGVWVEFVALWNRGQYEAMYDLLSPAAKQVSTLEAFQGYFEDAQERADVTQVTTEITSSLVTGTQAQVGFRKTLISDRFGSLEEQQSVTLAFSEGRWLLDWQPSLVLAQMSENCSLTVDQTDNMRGAIYDRSGKPLAALGIRVVVGVVPGEIDDEDLLLTALATILDDDRADIQAAYAGAARPDWFMPVGEISAEEAQQHYAELIAIPGVLMRERSVRHYPEGAVAAHITGYVGVISAEQLPELRANGYAEDDIIGQAGLEESFEAELAGRRGTKLLVLGPGGDVRAVAAEKAAEPSQSLYTTIDLPLQRLAVTVLGDKRGAVVALDPRDGQVLALLSSPSFDPNAIVAGMSGTAWNDLLNDEGRPLVNRSTQAELPPGSVFKVVTESAVLESGIFTKDSTFTCTGTWTGLGSNWPMNCWLRSGHGTVALEHGLTLSCDVVFYECGKALQESDRDTLPRFANEFGFGARTGLAALPESAGLVPTADWKSRTLGESWFAGDSVNMAIGQGNVLVTPLQMAVVFAAIANGGTRYRPQIALSLNQAPQAGAFKPEVLGALPVDADHLDSIKVGLYEGCMSPAGTAYSKLGSMAIPVAGKTGTAENPGEAPHAWFAGYAPADAPEIVIVVLLEQGGQGSLDASPLFRQLVEAYLQPTTG
ncbi:MAG: penicillin-binding protein 2 [Anaerolineae bacterium]